MNLAEMEFSIYPGCKGLADNDTLKKKTMNSQSHTNETACNFTNCALPILYDSSLFGSLGSLEYQTPFCLV